MAFPSDSRANFEGEPSFSRDYYTAYENENIEKPSSPLRCCFGCDNPVLHTLGRNQRVAKFAFSHHRRTG